MNNKRVIIFTIVVVLIILIVPTAFKIYKEHNDKLIMVVEKEFLYQAEKCFKENNCSEMIYLSDLYEKEYIEEKLFNPINKKYYSLDSYVNLKNKEIKLIL